MEARRRAAKKKKLKKMGKSKSTDTEEEEEEDIGDDGNKNVFNLFQFLHTFLLLEFDLYFSQSAVFLIIFTSL